MVKLYVFTNDDIEFVGLGDIDRADEYAADGFIVRYFEYL